MYKFNQCHVGLVIHRAPFFPEPSLTGLMRFILTDIASVNNRNAYDDLRFQAMFGRLLHKLHLVLIVCQYILKLTI